MPNSEPGAPDGQLEPESPHAVPLGKWQRIAATAIGLSLTGGGVASIFLAKSEAGSVALLLGGLVFLIIAVIGMSLHRVRFQEMELFFGIRQRERVTDLASRLPHGEALRLMQLLQETNNGAPYTEPLLTLIDSLFFEARVRDTVIGTLDEVERVEMHPEAGIGEPLLHVVRPDGMRIGVFAMFAPRANGDLTAEFDDEFIDILPRTGCDAVILITCVRDRGYLATLAERIRQEAGLPVTIEDWRPRGEARPLRPSIDQLCDEVRTAGAVPHSRNPVAEIAEPAS